MCQQNLICRLRMIMIQQSHKIRKQLDQRETIIKKRNPQPVKIKKIIFILGGSIVKHVEGWKLSKNVDRKDKVYVKSFSSAKVKCMKDYVKTLH